MWVLHFVYMGHGPLSPVQPGHSCFTLLQPRPQGPLLVDFQNGGSSGEDPGTQQKSRDRFVHGGWKFIQNGGQDKEGEDLGTMS